MAASRRLMKVKAILWRWPGGGVGVPGPGPPRRAAAPWGVATLHPSLRGPAVPLCRVWRRDVTGPPRPQPGRERKAAPGAVAAAAPWISLGSSRAPSSRSGAGPSVAAAAVRVEDAVDVWAGPGGPKLGALGEESRIPGWESAPRSRPVLGRGRQTLSPIPPAHSSGTGRLRGPRRERKEEGRRPKLGA
ncbi:hypothetical protein LEMLEM_LOCUS21128 [Lemmus lemmus]